MIPSKKLTRYDIAVIALTAILAALSVILSVTLTSRHAEYFKVSADGNTYTYPLSKNTEFTVSSAGIEYNISVDGGSVEITESGCPDKYCVKTGKISREGSSIVCVPGRLVISIHGGNIESQTGGGDEDFIVG